MAPPRAHGNRGKDATVASPIWQNNMVAACMTWPLTASVSFMQCYTRSIISCSTQ